MNSPTIGCPLLFHKTAGAFSGCRPAEAGTDRIDKDQVGVPQPCELVVNALIGRRLRRYKVFDGGLLGPTAPRCSHTDEAPGPPLKRKVIDVGKRPAAVL